jgi:hypothetical protein
MSVFEQVIFGLGIVFLVIAGVLLLATACAYLFATKMRFLSDPHCETFGNVEEVGTVIEPVKSIELAVIDVAEPPKLEETISEEENQTLSNNE